MVNKLNCVQERAAVNHTTTIKSLKTSMCNTFFQKIITFLKKLMKDAAKTS